MTELRPIWIEFPNQERKMIKIEERQRLAEALEAYLSGQDLELLRSGSLVLHTPEGYAVRPKETEGRDLPALGEYVMMIDPERVVGGARVRGSASRHDGLV